MEYHSGGSLPLLGRPRYCPGANANGGYLCETGHCCGESGCCTYYYELWWFWLLWTVLILFSCCCAYRHRRAKLRVQQQQRQRDISLLAYQGASSFPSSMLDLSFLASLKLPSYEEVAAQPSTPPPPYSSVFTAPRYPQPPRAAHPHLLSQHPGAQHPGALHRTLQPLSDGPSSLSSDNSSSCSCDSCCPSSPCSSSLSAPVTYETDTSHASTPSEATALALDSVAMETISAVAARLAPTLSSKDDDAPVAILIEQTNPAAAAPECITAVAAGSASPLETNAVPDLDTSFPVGITAPVKQQLDVTPTASGPTCLQSTEHSPSPDGGATLARTLDQTSFKQPRTLSLILDSAGGSVDTNPSLVPISLSNIPKLSPNTSPSQAAPPTRTLPSPNKSPNLNHLSSPSQGIAHFPTKPAGESSELTTEVLSVTEEGHLLKSPRVPTETTKRAPVDSLEDVSDLSKQTSELSKPSEMVAAPADQTNDKDTSSTGNSSLPQTPQTSSESVPAPLESAHPAQTSNELSKSQATTTSPISTSPKSPQDRITLDVDAKIRSPTLTDTTATEPTECVSLSVPDPSNSERPAVPTEQRQNCNPRGNAASALQFYSEIPPATPDPSPKANSLAADAISPTFDREVGKLSVMNSEVDEKCSRMLLIGSDLNLERPSTNVCVENEGADSFFPAITIQADPPSFAASPCSIPSPSLPQSPPGAMLLLDPLAALQPSDRSAASSGHASSLSPSPRNTQSPPKQTLFSPCVDVFEPVDPNWEDDESEEPPDEEYCEDSDVAADESQYRHRRLTGDSGIEVCRCRVEDEDEDDDEETEKAKVQDGGEKRTAGAELHDSVDCPARSRSGEDAALCSNDTSAETLAIPVETV